MSIWGRGVGGWALCLAVLSTSLVVACKDEKKSKTQESDDEDEDDDTSSKKKKKKKDAEEEADSGPKPTALASIPGFVVPAGGKYEHINMPMGDKVLEFDNYTYPTSTHPREKLHTDFKKELEKAGWAVTKDSGPGYIAKKDGTEVTIAFGEVSAAETKINVFPPKKAQAAPAVFAGTYTSKFGTVTLTQTRAEPGLVVGRYTGGNGGGPGTMTCAGVGKALACSWREGASVGMAEFMLDSVTGTLNGTWGMGKSSTANGPWVLTLKTAGQLD